MILKAILRQKMIEITQAKKNCPMQTLESNLENHSDTQRRLFKNSLLRKWGRPHFICEIKRASPSEGLMKRHLPVKNIVAQFEKGGAAAISVLTDKKFFGGSLELLARIRSLTTLPILRKEFVIDEYQLFESRLAGANAILLIVAILKRKQLAFMMKRSRTLRLDPLVEVHNTEELNIALDLGADIIGINNRNLDTLKMDLRVSETLIPKIPPGKLIVVESGIRSPQDLLRFQPFAIDAFLVGTYFMKSQSIVQAIQDLRQYRFGKQ